MGGVVVRAATLRMKTSPSYLIRGSPGWLEIPGQAWDNGAKGASTLPFESNITRGTEPGFFRANGDAGSNPG